MFGRNRHRDPEPTFAEKQAEYECAFQNIRFMSSIEPLMGLGEDGVVHPLHPVVKNLPNYFPESCEGKIIADADNLYQISASGKLCVQVCVECPRDDCPTSEGKDDSYRRFFDGSYVVIDATASELEDPFLDPKQITS